MTSRPPRSSYPAANPMLQALFDSVDLDQEPPMPVFTEENAYDPPSDYERWLTAMIWQRPQEGLAKRVEFLATLPDFQRPDNTDILPPGAPDPEPPRHWLTTPVHFGSWPDGRYTRFTYGSGGEYTFTNLDRCMTLYGDLCQGLEPRRIIDFGTGFGTTATAFAKLYPEAEVIGIDLAPHFIRFARGLAERRGIPNLTFYRQHGAQTVFGDASADVVVEAYVLHEQPLEEARAILAEMHRVLRPGGRYICADVIHDDDPEAREARVQRGKGPEPFLAEYMKLDLGTSLPELFGGPVTRLYEPGWDCMVWTGIKHT